MFKTIGVLVVLVTVGFGVAHYTGHLKLSGDLDVTKKGRVLINKSIGDAQDVTNKGFDVLRAETKMQNVTNKMSADEHKESH